MILAVDLAARFSAGVVMDHQREVHCQFDSWGRGPGEFCALIADTALLFGVEQIVVEDVPYGISKQFMIKPVLRLQGRLIAALEAAGVLDRTVFVAPATWQRVMQVWKSTPAQTAAFAASLGYFPPDTLEIHASQIPEKGPERTKARETLRKSTTDYVSAYLIARWAVESSGPLTSQQGVQTATPEGATPWLPRKTPSPLS